MLLPMKESMVWTGSQALLSAGTRGFISVGKIKGHYNDQADERCDNAPDHVDPICPPDIDEKTGDAQGKKRQGFINIGYRSIACFKIARQDACEMDHETR